jgi:DNA-binding Lrp family transcriptional regulator
MSKAASTHKNARSSGSALDARDDLDRALITLLQADARASTATLARKLGVARTTIVARLTRLEATGIIVGYTVRLGVDASDHAIHAQVGITIEPKLTVSVIRKLERLPELRQLWSVSGEFDYIAMLRAETTSRLDVLLDEIGAWEGVKKTMTSVVLAIRVDRS